MKIKKKFDIYFPSEELRKEYLESINDGFIIYAPKEQPLIVVFEEIIE